MARLGSPKKDHQARAAGARRDADAALATAKRALKDHNCTKAYMNLLEAWQGYGMIMAENKAGGSAWIPSSDFRDVGYEFSTMCVRDSWPAQSAGGRLHGSRKKRRRRKRR